VALRDELAERVGKAERILGVGVNVNVAKSTTLGADLSSISAKGM
jgi:hypothetical protein